MNDWLWFVLLGPAYIILVETIEMIGYIIDGLSRKQS
jgi:hypothetical protein